MTFKEMAELFGVEPHTVRNLVHKEDFLRGKFFPKKQYSGKIGQGFTRTSCRFHS
jgi:hypothetical protein